MSDDLPYLLKQLADSWKKIIKVVVACSTNVVFFFAMAIDTAGG